MQSFLQTFNSISSYVVIGLVVITFLLFILTISLMSSLSKLEKKYRKLMRGSESGNLEELITNYLDKVDNAVEESKQIKEMYSEINDNVKKCIQHVGMIRYKAFDDVGSDLSFSLVMLDDNYDGIIVTSIYGRNESLTYAKPINKGLSRYDLSEEEKQVLKEVSLRISESE